MPKILDNITLGTEPELLETLKSSHHLDAAIGYFNLRGWGLLAEAVDALPKRDGPKARVLVGIQETPSAEMHRLTRQRPSEPTDNATASSMKQETVEEYRSQLQVGLPTTGDEQALRLLIGQIEAGDVEVKIHTRHRLHAKLYLCHRDDTAAPRVGYVGSSNLTAAGLREQGELNVDVVDGDSTEKLTKWFEDRWNDPFSVDAMPELKQALEESWVSEEQLDPYLVYLKMAYHLSREAREGLIEYGIPASMKEQLLAFQEAAVKIAARIVMQRGGAMIGDVVGLGKTLEGTAIARLLQEEQGFETLVICPKNLVKMWETYLHEHEVRGKVESLSMVHKVLPDERRYRLVIIDEAHNLRSETRRDYKAIQQYIAENESKALLLTATPYNKQFGDLAAQLGLFVRSDADLGLRPERAIAAVGEVEFVQRFDGLLTSLGAFKRSEHLEDWQALMSQFLVRRTRRFVEDNYALADEKGQRYLSFGTGERFYFPKRKPKPTKHTLTADDPAHEMASDETLDAIRDLKLPRSQLGSYLRPGFATSDPGHQQLLTDLASADRGTLAGFNRITMFKRLSSSGPAFLKTLRRNRLRNLVAAHALETQQAMPIGPVGAALLDARTDTEPEDGDEFGDDGALGSLIGALDDEYEIAEAVYDELWAKNPAAVRWAPHDMFEDELLDDLRHDADVVSEMLERFGTWDATNDGKIGALVGLLTKRHRKDKVLVFTEAADTAHYVGEELIRRGVADVGVVTGDSDNATEMALRFSPRSNLVGAGAGTDEASESDEGSGEIDDELRVLISTDVLSEGQNLQDAHIVVNYDLPWAIVKLVQRAGRVDRIGQQSPEVLLYSLLPDDPIEFELNLRGRIKQRLGEHAALLGSDEAFFGDSSERKAVTRFEGSAIEVSMGEGIDDVDPVSMAYEIWRRASEKHPDTAKRVEGLPNVVYSTKPSAQKSGVLVHTLGVNGAHTFAMVELDGKARRVTPQEALLLAECEPETPAVPRLPDHHELTRDAVEGAQLLHAQPAVVAILGVSRKVWNVLNGQLSSYEDNLLFNIDDVERAMDAIQERSLREESRHRLARALKDRDRKDLAALVVELHNDDRLCVPATEGADAEPQIVCTMGLRGD